MRLPIALLLSVCACTSFHPVARTGGTVYPPDRTPGDGAVLPDAPPRDPADARRNRVAVQRGCRASSPPAEWVAIAYGKSDQCPRVREDNDYTVWVIERHAHKQTGSVMTICADQRIPRGWVKAEVEPGAECPGARVRAGSPTSLAIRRDIR